MLSTQSILSKTVDFVVVFELRRLYPSSIHIFGVYRGVLPRAEVFLRALLELCHVLELDLERGKHGTAFQSCGCALRRTDVGHGVFSWASGQNVALTRVSVQVGL